MHTIKARIAAGRDRGATPLEILAGLVLLGIIFGFLIVKFFGWRENTQDKGAQTTLRNALLAAETVYQQENDYLGSGGDAGDALGAVEPEITFDDDTGYDGSQGEDSNVVYVDAAADTIEMTVVADSGNHFCVLSVADSDDLADIGTFYNSLSETAVSAGGSVGCAIGDAEDGWPGV